MAGEAKKTTPSIGCLVIIFLTIIYLCRMTIAQTQPTPNHTPSTPASIILSTPTKKPELLPTKGHLFCNHNCIEFKINNLTKDAITFSLSGSENNEWLLPPGSTILKIKSGPSTYKAILSCGELKGELEGLNKMESSGFGGKVLAGYSIDIYCGFSPAP